MKTAKVRITSYRPAAAARPDTGLERLAAIQEAEKADADKWVSGLSRTALRGIAGDLARDFSWDRKDPWQRWKMARKGAVLRRLATLTPSHQS
jgi:hypothetical protein